MNRKNIELLIKKLEYLEKNDMDSLYNQSHYTHNCDTPACIAGHAIGLKIAGQLEGSDKINIKEVVVNKGNNYTEVAGEWLGLEEYQSDMLFQSDPLGTYHVTIYDAIETLRHLLKTEEVDWYNEGVIS